MVLCPSTEGNLGDGIFPLRKYQAAGGRWSIGTDSHVGLNPLEELRILDYGQRLISHKRNTYTSVQQGDSGAFAIEMANSAGRKAMNNFEGEFFKVGEPFNACILDGTHPLLANCSDESLASTIVYSTDSAMQSGTISQGREIVKDGTHIERTNIRERFNAVMRELGSR